MNLLHEFSLPLVYVKHFDIKHQSIYVEHLVASSTNDDLHGTEKCP